MPRPSLSDDRYRLGPRSEVRVAGADAPAFVERRLLTTSLTGKGGQVGGSVYSNSNHLTPDSPPARAGQLRGLFCSSFGVFRQSIPGGLSGCSLLSVDA